MLLSEVMIIGAEKKPHSRSGQAAVDHLAATGECSNCDLRGQDLRTAIAAGKKSADSQGTVVNLEGAILILADLSGTNLNGANCFGAIFMEANLRFADLRSTDLSRAILIFADLTRANLYKANLYKANLNDANTTDTIFD